MISTAPLTVRKYTFSYGEYHKDIETSSAEVEEPQQPDTISETYILNTNSRKFHRPDCSFASQISDANREEYTGTREELVEQGYTPCGYCNP